MEFVDTNVFIRVITQDDPAMARRAYIFFEAVQDGSRLVTTSEGVLVEVEQVLSSKKMYARSRDEIRTNLAAMLQFPGMKLDGKGRYIEALDLYVAHPRLSFVDCICVVHARHGRMSAIVSFDRGFDRVVGVARREP